ncbi:hypothetical protein R6Q57_002495 [Mikania cordata]
MASGSSNQSQKHHVGSKSMEMEEIVKYMSNLPSYLERGKPMQDRALNFGVLDWGRLEQWQYHHHKQNDITTNKYSPSGNYSSNRSSLRSHLNISTEEISAKDALVSHSSKKKIANQSRTTPKGIKKYDLHTQDLVESKSTDDMGTFQTASSSSSLSSKGKMKNQTTDRSRTKPKGFKNNDLHPQNLVESKSSDDTESFPKASSSSSSSSLKGKMKIQDEFVNETGSFQDLSNGTCDGTNHSVPKNDTPNSFPFKSEDDSNRKPRITNQIKTPEEKELSVISKNSDFKTGSIAASKSLFSFNMSSKLVGTKSATKELETAQDSKIKAKVKMDLGNCKEVRVDNSYVNKMNDSSSSTSRKQALFQIAVKNGRPFFTFSVDNSNEILAATVRSLTGKDNTNSWVYTFFTIHEVKKKKSGWLYHSTKDKGNTYLPNVTAQMKVSNPLVCNGTTREFILSSVDSGQSDQEYELAAIIVRFLRKTGEDENQDCFSTTVVLPGGHHSVPRKGEPSPLIERWRSGGRCDCGGWDVGCRLRTLINKVQSDRKSNPPESFDLFLQGDVINEKPFFSFSPINEGVFAVDYNASLQLLHAFSICISVIECRKSSHQTELRTYVAKRVDDDLPPVTYTSLPPVSPVGRV